MIKIVGGKYRSREIDVPSYLEVPTKSIVREGVMNALSMDIKGARCLDLFAGSGAMGIEFLSRGASYCLFSDINKEAITTIGNNLKKLNEGNGEAYLGDYESALNDYKGPFDIIFVDPPYKNRNYYGKALEIVETKGLLSTSGVLCFEYEGDDPLPGIDGYRARIYKYGRTFVKICWRDKK